MSAPLTEDDLHSLYLWVDDISLSRPKRNIARDFSDGVCVAEIMKHFFPSIVELHNFSPANSTKGKQTNWDTLNNKVFRKLHFDISDDEVRDIVSAVPGAIERFLKALQTKITQIKQKQEQGIGAYSSGAAATTANKRSGSAAGRGGISVSAAPQHHLPVQEAYHPQPSRGPQQQTTGGGGRHAAELMREKDQTIQELRESVLILTEKVSKLEQIIQVKDHKIATYEQRLSAAARRQ